MKNIISSFVLCLLLSVVALAQADKYSLVPVPAEMKYGTGKFELSFKTRIIASDAQGREMAGILNDMMLKNFGHKLEYQENKNKVNAIVLAPQADAASLGDEAYAINVTTQTFTITGKPAGQFYALQTLVQMLPPDMKHGKASLPAVTINDAPRFKYRGMHLDVSRHFSPVSFVKKYIDMMAMYKFNNFHWHLTDDQGWRIEIKKYPKLTTVGAWRKETVKDRLLNPYTGDNLPHGGFYTQEQIKDVVAYAKARKINVIPEIELPGHATAAITAYPELACHEGKYEVKTTWGIFKETFCPTDYTFKFLEDVIEETIALFPDSPYIHIGGDEVLKDHWKESAFVQELKKKENLKDEHEVQSYFVQRIEKFVNSKGKRIIGWDEILEGGLAPNATVMSWRGMRGGIEAAKSKHDVIMTPVDYSYFDYPQGDPRTEPLSFPAYLPMERVYSFDPVPPDLNAEEGKYIIGGQANMWTEYLKTPDRVEYMLFPRMMAMAESVWSPKAAKNYDDFLYRMPHQLSMLDKENVNYRIPEPGGLKTMMVDANQTSVSVPLTSRINGGKIFYTTDGSEPSIYSKEYNTPINIPLSANSNVVLKTIIVNKAGRRSSTYAATITNRKMLPAATVDPKIEGLNYSLYKGTFNSTEILDGTEPSKKGETKNLGLRQFEETQNFGVIWDGYIRVPEDGLYDFSVESDDGAVLVIGDETVVDNDGIHTRRTAVGDVPLQKGFHKFRLKYFQKDTDMLLNVRWGVKGRNTTGITGLFH